MSAPLPLTGCRVLDLGIITAGAATAAMLADLGADVIKIEAPSFADPFRGRWAGGAAGDPDDDRPQYFRMTNRGKRALAIDLKSETGRDVFLRMAERADIVVENFSRGVLDRLGIDYASLTRVNPDIILASISSQGDTGPDHRYVSYGSTLEAVAGMAWLQGYAGEGPAISGIELNYPDQVVALFASSMIVTAWYARRSGDGGAHLDLSQRELTSFLIGDAFAGDSPDERTGNADPAYVWQDMVRCGDGRWLAISVDADSTAAVTALMAAAKADDIAAYCAVRGIAEAGASLRATGIAVAEARNGCDVLADEGTGWNRAMARLPDGALVKGFAYQFDDRALAVSRQAPRLGEHSREILAEVGGFSTAEIDELVQAGVVCEPEPAPA